MKIIKKSLVIVETIFTLLILVAMCYNFNLGVDNHDVYYLVLTMIDYKILQLSIENLKFDIKDIDNA